MAETIIFCVDTWIRCLLFYVNLYRDITKNPLFKGLSRVLVKKQIFLNIYKNTPRKKNIVSNCIKKPPLSITDRSGLQNSFVRLERCKGTNNNLHSQAFLGKCKYSFFKSPK